MSRYYCAFEPDLGFYPNYSFEVGDIDGDGQREIAALSTDGNTLRVVRLDGSLVLQRTLHNYGSWGTPSLLFLDVDRDGRKEVIVPDGPPGSARVIAVNADNEIVRQARLENEEGDDYGIAVPALARFRRDADGHVGICAAVTGGRIVALDRHFRPLWTRAGLRHDFGHDFSIYDVNGDGVDEILITAVDRTSHYGPNVQGDLVILRADGTIRLRQPVRALTDDTHFDDLVVADIRGIGSKEILVDKGILFNLRGETVWDVSGTLDHGQWVTTAPNPHGLGLLSFIAELWGTEGKSKMVSPAGEVLWELGPDRHTRLREEQFAGYQVLPTRAHTVDWFRDGHYELVIGEQLAGPGGISCRQSFSHPLKLFFFDLEGRLLHEMPFTETRRCGYCYTGEVHSRALDMDNDGHPEWVFPKQDGRVMVIKKER